MKPSEEAIRRGTEKFFGWTNQWRDPENGPFDGDEVDFVRGFTGAILNSAYEIDEPKIRADQATQIIEWLQECDGTNCSSGPARQFADRIAEQFIHNDL